MRSGASGQHWLSSSARDDAQDDQRQRFAFGEVEPIGMTAFGKLLPCLKMTTHAQAGDQVSRPRVSLELYQTRGGVAGDPVMIVCAVSWPLASAASTVPITGPA